jgi:tctex1 domain-containing protein 2
VTRGPDDSKIPRYKLLVQVVIGELKGQGVRIMSQCLWDEKLDNFADCTFKRVAFD